MLSSLVNRISHILRSIPCVSSNHFDSESVTGTTSISPVAPIPRINKYPTINNPGVYQSGPSLYTLKHPDDHSGVTVPITIRSPSIYEIFDHHEATLALTNDHAELKPENLSWDEFTKFWNAHAAEHGPRFITWDAELRCYIHPLVLVTPYRK